MAPRNRHSSSEIRASVQRGLRTSPAPVTGLAGGDFTSGSGPGSARQHLRAPDICDAGDRRAIGARCSCAPGRRMGRSLQGPWHRPCGGRVGVPGSRGLGRTACGSHRLRHNGGVRDGCRSHLALPDRPSVVDIKPSLGARRGRHDLMSTIKSRPTMGYGNQPRFPRGIPLS